MLKNVHECKQLLVLGCNAECQTCNGKCVRINTTDTDFVNNQFAGDDVDGKRRVAMMYCCVLKFENIHFEQSMTCF